MPWFTDIEVEHGPRFPDIKVQLSRADLENGWSLHGTVRSALPVDVRHEFSLDALSGDYQYLMWTAMQWVDVY